MPFTGELPPLHMLGATLCRIQGSEASGGPPESITVWTNASPLSPAALPNVNPASDSIVGGERPKSLISPPCSTNDPERRVLTDPPPLPLGNPPARSDQQAAAVLVRCRGPSLPR
ncbi:unnamed protein product [Eretmochelys imbricata]